MAESGNTSDVDVAAALVQCKCWARSIKEDIKISTNSDASTTSHNWGDGQTKRAHSQ